jgi:hypothetical protein
MERCEVTAAVDILTTGHMGAPSARRGLTSAACELTSATCKLTSATRELTSVACELTSERRERTSERRDATSVAWRVQMNRRRVLIATVEVISKRCCVASRLEEASGDQSAMAEEPRCVPVMDEDVPVACQSVNAAREGVVTARSDVSPTRCG